jgi:NAD(P)-dependent dehydrogenase (short-subunit alcohol dehydrogenase family)
MDLNGKVAVVTGAANGIGLATVKHLLKNGAKVRTITTQRNQLSRAIIPVIVQPC